MLHPMKFYMHLLAFTLRNVLSTLGGSVTLILKRKQRNPTRI